MITLRFAQPEDAAKLLNIYRPYVEKTSYSFETEVPTEAEFRRRIETFSAKYPYLIAQEDGEIMGYAYAHAFHERAAYGWTVETSIYVAENTHRRGVGKMLYDALLNLLELQNIRTVCVLISIPNEPSIGFHQSMGFQMGGILPNVGYKLGAWHAVAYLYRPLGDAETPPSPMVPIRSLDPEMVVRVLNRTNS